MADYEMKLTPEGAAALKAIEDLNDVTIKVGWQSGGSMKTETGGPQPENGMQRKADGSIVSSPATLAEIAMYNEFGTSDIPARPFMKQAFENNRDEIESFVSEGLKKVAVSGKVQQFLQLLGVKLVDVVQSEIEEGQFESNSAETVRRKGSAHPLIDTATIKNSIGFMIEEG